MIPHPMLHQVVQKYVQQIQASQQPSHKQQRLEEPSRKVACHVGCRSLCVGGFWSTACTVTAGMEYGCTPGGTAHACHATSSTMVEGAHPSWHCTGPFPEGVHPSPVRPMVQDKKKAEMERQKELDELFMLTIKQPKLGEGRSWSEGRGCAGCI